jgi:hypothetical protein
MFTQPQLNHSAQKTSEDKNHMKVIDTHIDHLNDGAHLHLLRKGKLEKKLRMGPNAVHAFITHPDGTITDLGISYNALTNAGRDLWAAAFGNATHKTGTSTSAAAATTLTDTAGAFGTTAYVGWRVYSALTNITTAPVYGNIGSHTSTVLTLDQWWTPTETTPTPPASGNAYLIYPSFVPRFMGLTADTTAITGSETALTGEITGNGCNRSKATYAHTGGQATYTMQVIYTVTGSQAAIHRMGLFTASTLTAVGVLGFITNLNADATVGSGDTLTVTDTITLSG